MKLKVGDKVKFLNQIGGGIVTKIVSSQIVNVTDDTGFDIPTLVKDLIKVEPMQGAGKLFEQDIDVEVPAKQAVQPQNTASYDEDTISALRPIPEMRNIDKGIQPPILNTFSYYQTLKAEGCIVKPSLDLQFSQFRQCCPK